MSVKDITSPQAPIVVAQKLEVAKRSNSVRSTAQSTKARISRDEAFPAARSAWFILDDQCRRSIVEYLDVVSVARVDSAMTNKTHRAEWERALRGIKSVAFSDWEHHTNEDGFAALRYTMRRGIVVERVSIRIQEDSVASAGANLRWLLDQGRVYEDIAVLLIESKSLDISAVDSYGLHPLANASWCGHRQAVQALLTAGVAVNQKCGAGEGNSALLLAAYNGHVQVCDALIEAGADVNMTDQDGRTALMLASKMGYFSVVQALLKSGAVTTLNNIDRSGYTSLMNACDYGWPEIVGKLIDAGADVAWVNEQNISALSLAEAYGNQKCADALKMVGAQH